MAELDPAPDEGVDPNAAPADGEPDPNVNDEGQPDPVAALAMEMGWAPKEKWEGPEDQWKPADQFIKDGRDINRGLSRELRGMRDQLDRVTRTSSQLLEDKIAERDRYWQSVHRKAVEDGDHELAERAFEERGKLAAVPKDTEEARAAEAAAAAARDFATKNSWFGTQPLPTARAREIGDMLAKAGYPPEVQVAEAEKVIRREYPDLYPQPRQAPGVHGTRSRSADTRSRAKGYNDMPPESRAMADDYERRHGVKKEDFAKSYWAEQASNERKVG